MNAIPETYKQLLKKYWKLGACVHMARPSYTVYRLPDTPDVRKDMQSLGLPVDRTIDVVLVNNSWPNTVYHMLTLSFANGLLNKVQKLVPPDSAIPDTVTLQFSGNNVSYKRVI